MNKLVFFIPQIVKRTKVVVPRIMNNWSFRKNLHKFWTSLGEQLTPSELVATMLKNLEASDKSAYTKVHFKQKLLENYGDELVTSNEDEKPDIATLKLSVNTILRN